jgi:hypothetical protein
MNDSMTVQCSKGQLRSVEVSAEAGGDFSIHLTLGDVALSLGQQVIDRFHKDGWNEVVVVNELGPCWEYRGLRSAYNYGVTRQVASHRLAVMLDGRPIPEGMHVLHACDNPPCVNPAHLSIGTRSDNMRDMVAKGRHRVPNGNYHHATKITDAQVRQIRDGFTGRWGEVTELALKYGVSANQMSWILQGKRRPEAGGKIHPPRRPARTGAK